MVRRIMSGVVVVVLAVLCYEGYVTWKMKRSMLSGDVVAGPSEPLPAGNSVPLPMPTTRRAAPAPKADAPEDSTRTASQPATYPATDSQSPDAPDGTRLAGSGRYQVYRQGNLTYRIDTSSGQTCILYATEEEWRKPQVARRGCGNSGAQ